MTLTENTKKFILELSRDDCGGHDFSHALRVYNTAMKIAETEGGDKTVIMLASLLHDADDIKTSPSTHATLSNAVGFMKNENLDNAVITAVCEIIRTMSFSGSGKSIPESLEGKIVQDADRLDAIGAIGIGRAFAYGGKNGRPMYEENEKIRENMTEEEYHSANTSTIGHFYEKLLKLSSLMNTSAAKKIAASRDEFMRSFLCEFLAEWQGEK